MGPAASLSAFATLFVACATAQSTSTSQFGTVLNVTCTLDCQGGSKCARGNADFSAHSVDEPIPFLQKLNENGFHCECPAGRTGILCEREYESCGDGLHFCFHGGKCMPGIKDLYGNEKHYCDCADAVHDGKQYAGKYCEAESVDFCGSASEYGEVFCTNGGKCKSNYQNSLDRPCVCPNGYEGPRCEYNMGDSPKCSLQCENGGHCAIGTKEYTGNEYYKQFWETHQDYQHCVCPEGFFGVKCEIQGQQCGDDHCFNGGTCLTRNMPDGTTRNFCDCRTAKNSASAYGGQFCEAESTSFCSRMPDHNGRQFCVNGGTCKEESHLGCDCPVGYDGPICEFHESTIQDTECNLKCKHNGICRNGAKDTSFLEKFQIDLPEVHNITFNDDFEHCVCPKGYVGLQCEHMVNVCPGGEHICMNGAQCIPVDDSGKLEFACNCDSGHAPFHKFTGEFCELKSSDMCTYNGRPGLGANKDAFCVNGGKCKGHANEYEAHPGCTCPGGFEGPHCEKGEGDPDTGRKPPTQTDAAPGDVNPPKNDSDNDDDSQDGMGTIGIILLVVFIDVIILGALGIFFVMRSRRRQRDEEAEYGIPHRDINLMARDAPAPPTLENILSMGSAPQGSKGGKPKRGHTSIDFSDEFDDEDDDGESQNDLVNVAII